MALFVVYGNNGKTRKNNYSTTSNTEINRKERKNGMKIKYNCIDSDFFLLKKGTNCRVERRYI